MTKGIGTFVVVGILGAACCEGGQAPCDSDSGVEAECTDTNDSSSSSTSTEPTSTTAGPIACGNGTVEGDEECDDGNNIDDDSCSNNCTLTGCGDGVIQMSEECDLGQENADDGACTSQCQNAECGDGLVQQGVEDCDDTGESATCDADCTIAECGDGLTNIVAGEKCDDANTLELDGCTSSCQYTEGALTAGGDHTCARLEGGDIRCWGEGLYGRLGYGNTESIGDNELPSSVGTVPVGGPITQVAGIGVHTCALLDGSVKCWGLGYSGRLGYGNEDTIGDDEFPTDVGLVDVGEQVAQIAVGAGGGGYTCVLTNSGNVKCWGYGSSGHLGYGNTGGQVCIDENQLFNCEIDPICCIGDNEMPSSVGSVAVGGPSTYLAFGLERIYALREDGNIVSWGWGERGALGYGNTDNVGDDETPAAAGPINLGATAIGIGAGANHACAILEGGNLRCWGGNENGQLGYGHTEDIGDNEQPNSANTVDLGGEIVTQVSGGYSHTCALMENGDVRCWGSNFLGKIGTGNTGGQTCLDDQQMYDCSQAPQCCIGDNESPDSIAPVDLGGKAIQIVSGNSHNCAMLENGDVVCWGFGYRGALGGGNIEAIGDEPGEMPPSPVQFK